MAPDRVRVAYSVQSKPIIKRFRYGAGATCFDHMSLSESPYGIKFVNKVIRWYCLKLDDFNWNFEWFSDNYRDEVTGCDLDDEFAGRVTCGIRGRRDGLQRLVALVVRDVGWRNRSAGCGRRPTATSSADAARRCRHRRPQKMHQIESLT